VSFDVGTSAPTLAAVFLDLDGTLIDSETIWNEAIRCLVNQKGSAVSEMILARTHGAGGVPGAAPRARLARLATRSNGNPCGGVGA
jgi:beta-phosphoglucomutase-like phosphatase (HAD superfamily)